MKDAKFNLTKALPNANATNASNSMDINSDPNAGSEFSNQWRLAYVQCDYPALSDHTNTSVSNLITQQESSDNSNWANTNPKVECSVPGVASTGSAAKSFYMPIVPRNKRWIRFLQTVPTNGGTGNNATVNYDLVT